MTAIAEMLPIQENLLDLARSNLGPPHIQLADRVLYKCPFGRCRGYTLVIEPERYYCVGPCQSSGSVEDWQAHFAQPLLHTQRPTAYTRLWQRTAMPVVEQAEEALYSESATPLRDYLAQLGLIDCICIGKSTRTHPLIVDEQPRTFGAPLVIEVRQVGFRQGLAVRINAVASSHQVAYGVFQQAAGFGHGIA